MFLALIGYVSAQSLQFELDGTVYTDGQTIQCTYVEEWGEYVQYMQVRNISPNSDINVMVEKQVVEDIHGSDISFCWTECYSSAINISPTPVNVPANTLSEQELSVHVFFPAETQGHILVRMVAFDEVNPDDQVSILVRFANDGTGVSERLPQCKLGHAYPNPASSTVRFDYTLSSADRASVVVYNLLGQEVMNQQINNLQGVASFSVAGLNEGIYFCNLFVNGQAMKTEKFVVKK